MDCTGVSFSELNALVAGNSIKFSVVNGRVIMEPEQTGTLMIVPK